MNTDERGLNTNGFIGVYPRSSAAQSFLMGPFRQPLPAGFVSDIGLDGQSGEEDPDGGADQAVQSEGGQNRQNGEGAHCLDEA